MTREVHLSYDTSHTGNLRRIAAECADERTEMLLTGPPIFDESHMEDTLAGDFGAMLVAEHQSRCQACQRWMRSPKA